MNVYTNSGLPLLTKWSWGSYWSFLRFSSLNYIKTSVCVCVCVCVCVHACMCVCMHIPSTKRSILKIIVCLLDSLCCIPETNTILQINYPSIKNKQIIEFLSLEDSMDLNGFHQLEGMIHSLTGKSTTFSECHTMLSQQLLLHSSPFIYWACKGTFGPVEMALKAQTNDHFS